MRTRILESFLSALRLATLSACVAPAVLAQTIVVSSEFSSKDDLLAGISTSKTYTHTLVATGGVASVNGVSFSTMAAGLPSGTSVQGYQWSRSNAGYGAAATNANAVFGAYLYSDGYGAIAGWQYTFTLRNLTVGQPYELRFYALNTDGTARDRTFNISYSDGTNTASYSNYCENLYGTATLNSGWHYVGITYTPASSNVSITFTELNNFRSYLFHGLTNEVVSAVPEPSTYAALAGMAALGLAMWRRRRSQS